MLTSVNRLNFFYLLQLDTTRAPRAGEVNGKDYHFVAKDVMEREVAEGKFIESATFSGNMYGMLDLLW